MDHIDTEPPSGHVIHLQHHLGQVRFAKRGQAPEPRQPPVPEPEVSLGESGAAIPPDGGEAAGNVELMPAPIPICGISK